MKYTHVILLMFMLFPIFFSNINYIQTMNGVNDELNDQSHDFEFSCLYTHNKTLYFCDNNNKGLYKLNKTSDESERIKKWGDDLFSLTGVSMLQKKYIILDRENQTVYLDDNYPGMKRFGQSWDPHMWDPVSIGTINDTLFVLDKSRNNIRKYNISTQEYLGWVCKEGLYNGEINHSNDFAIDDDKIYIADTENNRIEVVDGNCSFISYIGISTKGIRLRKPEVVYVKDYVFVIDKPLSIYSERLTVFDKKGNTIESLTNFSCERYERDGELRKKDDCKIDDINDMTVIKEDDEYYVYMATDDYIDVFKFTDTRTREDLLERINNANETLEYAEKLFTASANTFNYSYDLEPMIEKLNLANDEYLSKDFHTSEIYLQGVEKWINGTYQHETEKVNSMINETLILFGDNINTITFKEDEKDIVNQLVNNYSAANISYHDGAWIDAMDKINNCCELFNKLNVNITPIHHEDNTSKELYEKLNSLNTTISMIKQKGDRYGMNFDLTQISESLTVAEQYIKSKDYDLANDTLDSINKSLLEFVSVIKDHEAQVSDANTTINEYYLNFTRIENSSNTDFTGEENDFKTAYSIVEKQPAHAINIAKKAYDSAVKKSRGLQLCTIPLLTLTLLFIMVKRW